MAKKTKKAKMAKAAKLPRKRNPQDSTLRNTRASMRHIELLEDQVGTLANALVEIKADIAAIQQQLTNAAVDREDIRQRLQDATARLDQAATILPKS